MVLFSFHLQLFHQSYTLFAAASALRSGLFNVAKTVTRGFEGQRGIHCEVGQKQLDAGRIHKSVSKIQKGNRK